MRTIPRSLCGLLVLLLLVLPAGSAMAKGKADELSPKYKKWLTEEVVWIISELERDVFLELASDFERDNFIDAFWAARDPSPGTPRNEYREEHYRRFTYASSKFTGEGAPGWKTDRGRMYIQLGPPAQIFDYHHLYEVYPCELWFYSAREHSSLPNHFYLLFWEREGIGGFRLYSPYNDGPERLVHSVHNDTREEAYRYLHGLNIELARATITLIPTEPIDPHYLTPTLTSDILVGRIFDLPRQEAPVRYLARFVPQDSSLREKVEASYSYHFQPMRATFLPVTGEDGRTLVHYALHISPRDLSFVQYEDQYYVSLQISLTVANEEGQTLWQGQRDFVQYFKADEFRQVQSAALVFKDKVGLVPGRFKLSLVVINNANSQTYQYEKNVTIPETPAAVPEMSPLVLVGNVEKAQSAASVLDNLVFSFFGYRFQPLLQRIVNPGEPLGVLYQMYYPPDKAREEQGEALRLEYRILDRSGADTVELLEDQVLKGKFNQRGTLLNFKQIPLDKLLSGTYTLVVSTREPSGQVLTSQNISFTVEKALGASPEKAFVSPALEADNSGLYDYQRAKILEQNGQTAQAVTYLEAAVRQSPALTAAYVDLARVEKGRGRPPQALALIQTVKERQDFPRDGHLLLADIHLALGDPVSARRVTDAFRDRFSPTRAEYAELARLYGLLGDEVQAGEMRNLSGGEPAREE